MFMHLEGKVAFISGAASGLGAATVRALSQHNVKIVLFDKDGAAINALSQEVGGLCVIGDVTNEEHVKQAIAEASAKWGSIHIVVNCAGILRGSRLVGRNGPMDLALFNQVMQVNVVGTFNVMRLIAAHMETQDPVTPEGERGVIINIASIAAWEGQVGQVAYSASKGAVASMTLPVARELAQVGIRVMCIAPGVMETPMITETAEKLQHSLYEQMEFPKRFGQPQEFACLVKQIIENSYLNGSIIRLDGAMRMGSR
jgi:NAD(P)-dependent dehydrogenase (short-subunit alcohol dehydrogenase family)